MGDQEFERWSELLERLSLSDDYMPAVEYFSHFSSKISHHIERHLDGFGGGFQGYYSCRFPDVGDGEDDNASGPKGVLLIRDLTCGDPHDQDYTEFLMPFSEFLRWMRAIARFWSEIHPCDEAKMQLLFQERDLAYFESEVGPRFDNGATWWHKIEGQRRTANTNCRLHIPSPQWQYAATYFRLLPDSRFPSWLRDLAAGRELPAISQIQIQRLAHGGLKFFTPSWEKSEGQYVEITRTEFDVLIERLVMAFIERRPRHREEVWGLMVQRRSRS